MNNTDKPFLQLPPNGDMLHEQAVLCSRLARLLVSSLSALDWQALRFADRSRLARALAMLTNDASLATLAAGSKAEQQANTPPAKPLSGNTPPCLSE